MRSRLNDVLRIFGVALFAAVFSGCVYMRLGDKPIRYEGVEPGWSYMRVMVRGWPVPYIYDKVGLSPGNAADWVGVLLGVDSFRAGPFFIDVAIYAVVFAIVWLLMRRRRAAVGMLCFLTASLFADNARISRDDTPYGEPAVARHPTDAKRFIAIASKFTSEGPLLPVAFVSKDGGETWIEKALPTPMPLVDAVDCQLAFSENGVAYALALLAAPKTRIVLFRSRDGGDSWELASVIEGERSYDLPFIVARGKEVVIASEYAGGLALLRSTDEGTTFGAPHTWRPAANLEHNAMNPLWLGNTIHVPYVDYGEELDSTRIWIASTSDFGKTRSAPAVVASIPRSRPGHSRFAASGDRLHAVLASGTEEKRTISVVTGPKWGRPVVVSNPNAQAFRPSIAVSSSGEIGATWIEVEAGCTRLWFSSSRDGGRSFSKPAPVSEDLSCGDTPANAAAFRRWEQGGDYYALGADGETFVAVWPDARAGTFQIYFARITSPSP